MPKISDLTENTMSEQFAVIIMGSDSDLPLVNNTLDVLKGFDIKYEVRVASAHRTPDVVSNYGC